MEPSREKRPDAGRFSHHPLRELVIAELAMRQHGVVALRQLLVLELTASAVRSRVASGRLLRVHAGVYAVGHAPLTRDGHYMAAVLACGPDAALSHRSCADKRGLRRTSRSAIDVTTARQGGRSHRGIDAHTSTTLLPRDVETVDAIRCTSVARTLLDLSAVEPRRGVERAYDQADVLALLDAARIDDILSRASGHRGAAVLRAVHEDRARAGTLTRSELEEHFLALCRATPDVPRPQVNAWIALEPTGLEADFLWREQRLIAEVDGRAVHTTARAFEHDRRRDQRLLLAGFGVVRFTWRQVVEEPAAVQATMTALLAGEPVRRPGSA